MVQPIQKNFPSTIVHYVSHPYVVDNVQDNFVYILELVFWSFKSCADSFNYCKPIVQVDGTFLSNKGHDSLLIANVQDDNHNIFPLTFAIIEGETKETMI